MAKTAPAKPPTLPAPAAPAVDDDDEPVEPDVELELGEGVGVGAAVLHVGTVVGSVTPWGLHSESAYLSVSFNWAALQSLVLAMQQTMLLMKALSLQKHPMSEDLQPATEPITFPTQSRCMTMKRSVTETNVGDRGAAAAASNGLIERHTRPGDGDWELTAHSGTLPTDWAAASPAAMETIRVVFILLARAVVLKGLGIGPKNFLEEQPGICARRKKG